MLKSELGRICSVSLQKMIYFRWDIIFYFLCSFSISFFCIVIKKRAVNERQVSKRTNERLNGTGGGNEEKENEKRKKLQRINMFSIKCTLICVLLEREQDEWHCIQMETRTRARAHQQKKPAKKNGKKSCSNERTRSRQEKNWSLNCGVHIKMCQQLAFRANDDDVYKVLPHFKLAASHTDKCVELCFGRCGK